jgi:hypothetical protein
VLDDDVGAGVLELLDPVDQLLVAEPFGAGGVADDVEEADRQRHRGGVRDGEHPPRRADQMTAPDVVLQRLDQRQHLPRQGDQVLDLVAAPLPGDLGQQRRLPLG